MNQIKSVVSRARAITDRNGNKEKENISLEPAQTNYNEGSPKRYSALKQQSLKIQAFSQGRLVEKLKAAISAVCVNRKYMICGC
jgi:hypothetical protein